MQIWVNIYFINSSRNWKQKGKMNAREANVCKIPLISQICTFLIKKQNVAINECTKQNRKKAEFILIEFLWKNSCFHIFQKQRKKTRSCKGKKSSSKLSVMHHNTIALLCFIFSFDFVQNICLHFYLSISNAFA